MYRCLVASLLVAVATAQYGLPNYGLPGGYYPTPNNYYNQWYSPSPSSNPYYDYNWQPSVQCTSHYQCAPNQYCFDCDVCKDNARRQGFNPQTYCGSCSSGGYPSLANQPAAYGALASLYGVQAQFQTLGSCGSLENCLADDDSIDGSCPASTLGDECYWDRDCAYGEVCWGARTCPPNQYCPWEDDEESGTCEAPYGPASGPAGYPGYNQYNQNNQYNNQYYSSYYNNMASNPYMNQYSYPGYNYNGFNNYNNYQNPYTSYNNILGGGMYDSLYYGNGYNTGIYNQGLYNTGSLYSTGSMYNSYNTLYSGANSLLSTVNPNAMYSTFPSSDVLMNSPNAMFSTLPVDNSLINGWISSREGDN